MGARERRCGRRERRCGSRALELQRAALQRQAGWGAGAGRARKPAGGLATTATDAQPPRWRAARARLTLTSAAKVPMVESYLSRWLACLTPPESLTHTTSRLVLVRPSTQRRNWRPMRPKPLMATRIFLADTVTCLLPVERTCGRRGGGGRGAGRGVGARGERAQGAREGGRRQRARAAGGRSQSRRARQLLPERRLSGCRRAGGRPWCTTRCYLLCWAPRTAVLRATRPARVGVEVFSRVLRDMPVYSVYQRGGRGMAGG